MDCETAVTVWGCIQKSALSDLRNDFVELIVRYARMRVDYLLAEAEQRIVLEDGRAACHNALIASCDVLACNMARCGEDATWREQLGKDRKEIGDFACYVHAILGIAGR